MHTTEVSAINHEYCMMYMYMCVSRLLKYSLVNDIHVSNDSAVARAHKI